MWKSIDIPCFILKFNKKNNFKLMSLDVKHTCLVMSNLFTGCTVSHLLKITAAVYSIARLNIHVSTCSSCLQWILIPIKIYMYFNKSRVYVLYILHQKICRGSLHAFLSFKQKFLVSSLILLAVVFLLAAVLIAIFMVNCPRDNPPSLFT